MANKQVDELTEDSSPAAGTIIYTEVDPTGTPADRKTKIEDIHAGAIHKTAKGADIASAATLTPGTDGNYFDVTGTTTITAIATVGVGTEITLHFDGALTLTHHATDLILPGGANITTASGDEAKFIEYATGDWRCVSYTKASGAAITGGGDTWNWVTPGLDTGATAAAGDWVIGEATTIGITIDLKASPSDNEKIRVQSDNSSTNTVTVGRNGSNINGQASDFSINNADETVEFVYDGTNSTWRSFGP